MERFWVDDVYRRQNGNQKNKKGIISTEMVNKALEIAYNTHKDQTDKAGRPYILRVIHVAEQMQGEFPVCAALLCDTIRHGITFEELSDAGFSEKVIEAVKILDRDPMISIMEHAQKIKDSRNSIAANIALAGLLYDCDLSKFRDIDDEIIAWYDRCIQTIAVFENDNHTNRWRDSDMQYIYTAASTRVLDIKMDAPSIGGRLSNLAKRPFNFHGIECGSIEGALQSFRFSDQARQCEICRLHGMQSKKAGRDQDWQTAQTLYWMEKPFARESEEYQTLLNELYKAAFDQNERFREDLALSKGYKLLHSIGYDDPRKTILTKDEFISRLEWLRDLSKER